MQIVHLPRELTIGLCFVLWPLLQEASARICHKLRDAHLSCDNFLFRPRRWENGGKFYDRIFKISKWKKLLPDGGSIRKGAFRKKHLESFSKDHLERYLIESCRAELSHWLAMTPFWVFGFFTPPDVILYMLIYAVAVNMPCIIAQRYNRPRVIRLLHRMGGRV
jgi:glycosyl-4,4'-diaponeurosporenoate acyltransferase